ncbi:hypothetical protein HMPREF9080_02114 [Cardiobacterium valvarum F0432]|uniref:Uncharacterized protein n=1 Tax=Cardiobacterium valvarum F0432 TaxID=797473 RepID=G9ZH57_9GAMM|nr:hypothetical protein HMPREF9080_02114 [Cardiobacterium valvarum F0432]
MGNGVLDGHAYQALAAVFGDGFDAESRPFEEVRAEFAAQEVGEFAVFFAAGGVFNAGIDVFGVFAVDDHVHFFRAQHRRGDAGVVAHRADAGVEVECLAQADVERAETAADGRGERPFDGDAQLAQGVAGAVRVVGAVLGEGVFAQRQFDPVDAADIAVAAGDSNVPDAARGLHDFRADAVAADAADARLGGNVPLAVVVADGFAGGGCSHGGLLGLG